MTKASYTKCVFAHSFISYWLDYSCSGSLGVLESIPEVTDMQEYTLDGSAVYHRTHTTHTSGCKWTARHQENTQTKSKLESFSMTTGLPCVFRMLSAIFLNSWWLHSCLKVSPWPHINVFISQRYWMLEARLHRGESLPMCASFMNSCHL